MANYWSIAIFLYLTISGSLAIIRCYDCGDRKLCQHPFKASNSGVKISTCNGSCTKAQYGELHERHCIDAKQPDGCRDVTIKGRTMDVCFCDTDLCNGSVSPRYVAALFIPVTAAMMFLWQM